MEYLDIKVTKKIIPPVSDLLILNNFNGTYNYNEFKINIESIRKRVNGLNFKKKSELIYFCLVLYKYFLDGEERPSDEYVSEERVLFSFSFFKEISRIVIYSKNKITSFYMPFIPKDQLGNRSLESRLNTGEVVSLDELIFLIEYFKYNMFFSFESDTLFNQSLKIESIKDSFSEQTMGFKFLDEDKLSRLVSELLFYDSSYLRYDIDLLHSLDENQEFRRDRVFQHPPYHIDSDYRDAPSYKIGFDKKLSSSEFLNLFQMEDAVYSMIIRENYEPENLVLDVKDFKRSLSQID